MQKIPYGYCHCGCGQEAKLAKQTDTKRGYVQGKPFRFLNGHHNKLLINKIDSPKFLKHFMKKVVVTDGCWLWTGHLNHAGYGVIKLDGKFQLAHRVSFALDTKNWPEDMKVCHKCDNPPCVNPSHLFMGTDADNTTDKVEKDRHARGERHGNAKLTEGDVREIRELCSIGTLSREQIASIYGVSRRLIGYANKEGWKCVA